MPSRVRLAILLAASFAVAAAFFATLGSGKGRPATTAGFEGSVRPPGIPAARFRLTDQDGRVVSADQLRGKVAVVTFLYTTCVDTCPLTAAQVRGALDDLGHDVPAVAIAVDPPNDTPARARRFLAKARMTGRMRFLLGPGDELQRQWRAFGIQRQTDHLEHSAYVVLLDRHGVQRVGFPPDQLTPETLAHDIRVLEDEPA